METGSVIFDHSFRRGSIHPRGNRLSRSRAIFSIYEGIHNLSPRKLRKARSSKDHRRRRFFFLFSKIVNASHACKCACSRLYACVRAYARDRVCAVRVKAMLTDCKSTDDFLNGEIDVKFTYDFHRLVRSSYRAFPSDYFTLHIIQVHDREKKQRRESEFDRSKAQFS